jgi:protein gp37
MLDWQLLTKRPNLIRRTLPPDLHGAPNIWLGTSVESAEYMWRIEKLIETPAAVHFLSIEPLLGPIPNLKLDDIEWVICGGESGKRHRPVQPDWVREVRDQVISARIPFFFKQWGGRQPKSGGKILDGREWCEFPLASTNTQTENL